MDGMLIVVHIYISHHFLKLKCILKRINNLINLPDVQLSPLIARNGLSHLVHDISSDDRDP